jgi:hypothetical protein
VLVPRETGDRALLVLGVGCAIDRSRLARGVAAGVGDVSRDPPRLAGESCFVEVSGTPVEVVTRRGGVSLELLLFRGTYLSVEGFRS